MRPTRWSPFDGVWSPLEQFQTEMNQLFNRWVGDRPRLLNVGGFPAMNAWEDVDSLHLEAELPGMEFKDLEIYVSNGNQLTVKGERKTPLPERAVWHRQERTFGKFTRSITLPFQVDADRVEAKLENGVLSVRLAKHESARPRKITVKAE